MDEAFKYLMKHENVEEKDYPYKGKDNKCDVDEKKGVVQVVNFQDVEENDPKALTDAVGNIGPVSIAVNAGSLGW